jgi:hypothetical protein
MDLKKHDFVTTRHECTQRSPMPAEGARLAQNWLHRDAHPVPGFHPALYRCPHCGIEFRDPTVH